MFVIGTTQKLMKEIGGEVSVYNGGIDKGFFRWHMNMFKLGRYKCILFKIHVKGLDAIHGTPVIDIKPVLKEFLPAGEIRQPAWVSELMKNYWN
ncbi:hypothetical protein JOC77_002210 [Peribacillus deserti]|uniref:TsaA-like domain-containing protein n=1 Tax=Peribacillus deserti TaxID=673318 RepID=A0ABS2QJ67_9BACI|nr:hypothetical protein [Peribacillus deserti]